MGCVGYNIKGKGELRKEEMEGRNKRIKKIAKKKKKRKKKKRRKKKKKKKKKEKKKKKKQGIDTRIEIQKEMRILQV